MKLKSSKFNCLSVCEDGTLRMYNSMTGINSLMIVGADIKDQVLSVLSGDLSSDIIPQYISKQLVEHGYLIPSDRDENDCVKKRMAEIVLNERYLHLIIMPTEQCNFRCKYCYETFEKGKMSKTTQDAVIKYVKKNILNYVGLVVSWFGGEPLMAIDVVEYLSENFIKICKSAKRTYTSGMTTNGYNLTPDVFARLYKLKIMNYQITLDGAKAQHDNQRALANGEGTFDKIINNLSQIKNMRALGTVFNIRTNFTKAIIDHIDDYLSFYSETFGDDPRFDLYVQQAGDWGGTRVKKFSMELISSPYSFILEKLKMHNITFGRAAHFNELQCEMNVCYAARQSSFVIGSDGTIYKCTVHFDMPENIVGLLNENGLMELNENFNKWIVPFAEIEDKCKECPKCASCLPVGCPYGFMKSKHSSCSPMWIGDFGAFLGRIRSENFFHLSKDD